VKHPVYQNSSPRAACLGSGARGASISDCGACPWCCPGRVGGVADRRRATALRAPKRRAQHAQRDACAAPMIAQSPPCYPAACVCG
jgi:hypothetical protein